jgi:hypothetical protein
MTPPPLLTQTPPLTWPKRHPTAFNWALGAGAVLVLTAVMVFVFSMIVGFIKSSDAYVGAIARAKASPAVTAALGAPLHEGWLVTGNIHVSGPTGLAELAIPVSGPKGQATIYVEATKHLGAWQFDHLVVQLEPTHERIDLAPIAPPATPAR